MSRPSAVATRRPRWITVASHRTEPVSNTRCTAHNASGIHIVHCSSRCMKWRMRYGSIVKTTAGVDNTGGWQYIQTTGMVKANLSAYSTY